MAGILSSGMLAADDLIHVVGRGDTIYSLSRFYQVTADELMRANGITDPSKLSVGKRLIIPASADGSSGDVAVISASTSAAQASASSGAASSGAAAQTLVNYRAVRGDTLFSIARTNGITLQRLLEINGFSSNHVLKIGDVIKVPARATGNTMPGTASNPPPGNNSASGLFALRWPVTPKSIDYMTGQMGVVVEGEQFETVRSLTQGKVVSAGPWRKFGRVVIVETAGGYYYMYGGCETITVNVGDRITPGMEVGRLGVNAVSAKPQLFFMVFRNDTPMDPALAPRAGGNSRT
ncbi:MAG: LysM peptidoglycan-binding domain-containing protein [Treponema sp.]|nr:LysM peptidoglycan-binding domain-containing protein [Treponema sp.]